jgi:chromate transporter
MCLFAGTLYHYSIENPKLDFLKYIQPMAVGFVIFAAYKIKNLFVTRKHHWVLMICSAALAIIYHTPFFFPVILFVGGLVSNLLKKTDYTDIHSVKNISWGNFYLFVGVFLLSAIIGALTHWKPILIFENIYRYGSLVFGGGHVLIPMMYNQFVEFKAYLKPDEFLAGVGILQAIPGPVFSFSTFAGAMALKEFGYAGILLGSVIGTIAIFLPGTLLIFFVYPIWNQVKLFSPVKNALEGINATSAGLVIASAYLLFLPVEVNEMNMLVLLSTLFLLLTTKLPYPLIVLICVITGLFF